MTDANTIIIRPAERHQIKAKALLFAETGGGKTFSAILLARGLVGPKGRIGFLDTESGRGDRYAGLAGGYDIARLEPPFTPERYIEAIDAFEAAGYDCLIIDSASHEWEGTGGILEMAEAIEMRTGKSGLHCWNKPKAAHKKFINRLLQAKMHIIICARAREKSVAGPKDNRGRDTIVSAGVQPIIEKNMPFEMDVSMCLDQDSKLPILKKCPADLLPAFPKGEMITVETGRVIGEWLAGGVAVDHEFIQIAGAGREAARRGTAALGKWWKELTPAQQHGLVQMKDAELKSIARAVDHMNADLEEATRHAASNAPVEVAKDPLTDPRDVNARAETLDTALTDCFQEKDLDGLRRVWENAQEIKVLLARHDPKKLTELTDLFDGYVEQLS